MPQRYVEYSYVAKERAILCSGFTVFPVPSRRNAVAARSLRGRTYMLSVREQYRRYSLFVLIASLGVTVFLCLTPFLSGLLGAATIYVLLRGQMRVLAGRYRWRRSAAAALLTVDLWQESNLQSLLAGIPKLAQRLVGGLASFAVNLIVLLFVLYFMLVGGLRMEAYCRELLPFSRSVGRDALHEIRMIVRSNAIGIPLLAAVQGVVAYLGYLLFGAPSPLFWGVLTCLATIIPIVGTALVWLPLALYMGLEGNWGPAVGLALYGTLVVTHVDNVVRFVMQKRMADTHPLVTVFGVFVGLSLFGFMGVIFGPLLLAMFVFCVDLFKRKYLDRKPDSELFLPGGGDRA